MSDMQKQGSEKGAKKPWYRRRSQSGGKKPAVAQPVKPKGNYAFIDSQNLNLGVQKLGWKMDWRKFRDWLRTEHNVTHAYMFIGYMQENEALYEQMYEHGFLVVLKPTLEIKPRPAHHSQKMAKAQVASGKGSTQQPSEKGVQKTEVEEKSQVKGNIDADLVLYAMKELPNYDKAIIVSGDGDFFALVEYLVQQKKLHKLMTPNKRYSTLLQEFDAYIDGIDLHRRELAYRDFRKHRAPRTTPGN